MSVSSHFMSLEGPSESSPQVSKLGLHVAVLALLEDRETHNTHLSLAYLYSRDPKLDGKKKAEIIQQCLKKAAESKIDSSKFSIDIDLAKILLKQFPSNHIDIGNQSLLNYCMPGCLFSGFLAESFTADRQSFNCILQYRDPSDLRFTNSDRVNLLVPKSMDLEKALALSAALHPRIIGPIAVTAHVDLIDVDGVRLHIPFALVRRHIKYSPIQALLKNIKDLTLGVKYLSILADVATGLAHLHSRGLVHGNPSVNNMVQVADGGALLCTGIGDQVQLAPESKEKNCFTTATDVFHFGVTLSYLLIPQLSEEPFNLKELEKFKKEIKTRLPSWCPQQMSVLLLKCLQQNPQERLPMQKVAEELLAIVASAKPKEAYSLETRDRHERKADDDMDDSFEIPRTLGLHYRNRTTRVETAKTEKTDSKGSKP
jgi:hypothetical protein